MKRTSFELHAHAEELVEPLHLSNDQIDDHLMGDLDGVAAAHLTACEQCAERVATASEPIATFRDITIAWSERRSATMPIPVVEADALVWQRRAGWAMTACAVVVGISFFGNARKAEMLRMSEQTTQTASVTPVRAMSAPATAEVRDGDDGAKDTAARYSRDNRMLRAIDSELDASVETPAAMGLETVSDEGRGQGIAISVRN